MNEMGNFIEHKKPKTCTKCRKEISENGLFVEEKELLYHLSCYNYTVKEREEDNIE